jgi:hypothetical protein
MDRNRRSRSPEYAVTSITSRQALKTLLGWISDLPCRIDFYARGKWRSLRRLFSIDPQEEFK